ncbi:hypothetical protein HU200_027937 [Digitaria exilis]|uniref:Late embryogenesis abundant protein LEA-2 subgroup domain-containing protein n=1 Tax=Digitaria exilis TaxID=1010633 RepID=A0A835BSL2_9POAL|nr:hypothetical protein HU200_027937 [Digitaria exilis]
MATEEPATPATNTPTIQPQEEDTPAAAATDTPAIDQPQEDGDPPPAAPATDTPAIDQPQEDDDPPAAAPATKTPAIQPHEDVYFPPPPPYDDMGCLLNLLSKVESMLDMKKIGTFLLVSIINLGISTGFAAVTSTIFWFFYFHPHTLHPRIGSAVLTTFDLPSSTAGHSALLYDLTLNVTFINKSSLTKVRFDHVISGLYYGGTKVGPSDYSVPSFKLKQERSRRVTLALQGQAKKVSADMAETFARERSEGLFNINVKVKTMLNYRFFPHRMTYYYEYDCWLQFPPVPGNGTTAVTGGFKCDVTK